MSKTTEAASSVPNGTRAERVNESQGWLPIESAPRDGTRVIVAWPTGSTYITHMVGEADFQIFYQQWHRPMGCRIAVEPTHWMPLPEPPKPHSVR